MSECGCPVLHGAKVECRCGVDCATCWPWAHEPVDDSDENRTVYYSVDELLVALDLNE